MNKIIIIFFLLVVIKSNCQNVVLVIIDGARYTETFGDASNTNIPNMADLAKQGALLNYFYNDSLTFTSAAIPSIWCGTWTKINDTVYSNSNTQYTVKPSIFEYIRKQKNITADKCIYSLKYVSSLWLPSFHKNYGPNYWPLTISKGANDNQVLENSIEAIGTYHPQFLLVYFADVDHYGHSGIWNDYIGAIKNADAAVGKLWQVLQDDPFYTGNTTMIVTNDHGRHDDSHGGFKGHGCSCQGCRQIMFLALGPSVKKNYISYNSHRLPDIAVTVASVLNVNPEYATGKVVSEIFITNKIESDSYSEQIIINAHSIAFNSPFEKDTQIDVYNLLGEKLWSTLLMAGNKENIEWNHGFKSGIYLVSLRNSDFTISNKIMIK